MPVEVNHPGQSLGFMIKNENTTLVFTQDTGPTERIWEVAGQEKNLKAIFTETSFPNHLSPLSSRRAAIIPPHPLLKRSQKCPKMSPSI